MLNILKIILIVDKGFKKKTINSIVDRQNVERKKILILGLFMWYGQKRTFNLHKWQLQVICCKLICCVVSRIQRLATVQASIQILCKHTF